MDSLIEFLTDVETVFERLLLALPIILNEIPPSIACVSSKECSLTFSEETFFDHPSVYVNVIFSLPAEF